MLISKHLVRPTDQADPDAAAGLAGLAELADLVAVVRVETWEADSVHTRLVR